jgi:hypothetical protein
VSIGRRPDAPQAEDETGKKRYALRKELPEPVFGQIKQARGFRQFLLRGKEKVRGEWRLICTGHNMLKLFLASSIGLLGKDSMDWAISLT